MNRVIWTDGIPPPVGVPYRVVMTSTRQGTADLIPKAVEPERPAYVNAKGEPSGSPFCINAVGAELRFRRPDSFALPVA